jgi:hypothetical protein
MAPPLVRGFEVKGFLPGFDGPLAGNVNKAHPIEAATVRRGVVNEEFDFRLVISDNLS